MNPALARHLQTLGLERSPFPPTPDAAAYYATAALESELVEAAHALRTRAGFVLLTGEVGTGKSTFLRRLLAQLEDDGMVVSLVLNTFLQGDDLLAAVLRDFGLKPHGNAASDIEALNRFLINRWQAGCTCVLIIDDAQNLSLASLELVRLLTSLETGQEKLLQIVLSGQPELRDNLDQPQIRQLTSRICKHVRLEPMDAARTRDYVAFRLAAAGAGDRIGLLHDAATALHRCSGGNPRHIHLIMDRCLYGLYAQPPEHRRIDTALVRRAAAQAGALPARRQRRPTSLMLAATMTAAACLGIAGLLLGSTESRAGASPDIPSTPALAATPSPDAGWRSCLQRTANPQQRLDWVAENTARAVARNPDSCTRHHNGRWQIAWTPPAQAAAFKNPTQVRDALRQLQQQLMHSGHYDGAIDGQFGRLTARALARFQQAHALPASGALDPLTLLLLDAVDDGTASFSRTTDSASHGNG